VLEKYCKHLMVKTLKQDNNNVHLHMQWKERVTCLFTILLYLIDSAVVILVFAFLFSSTYHIVSSCILVYSVSSTCYTFSLLFGTSLFNCFIQVLLFVGSLLVMLVEYVPLMEQDSSASVTGKT
jgi:VIT1/CCC1 family predicted Fe2+/Mn2+ transporter